MKIAVMQVASIFLNKEKTTDKIISLMEEASSHGAGMCVFSESFLPGYPIWVYLKNSAIFEDPSHKEAYSLYYKQCVDVDGPEIRKICEASKRLGILVVLGISEKNSLHCSIYCTLLTIHPIDGIINIHRKLIPTLSERTIWANGDAAGLNTIKWEDWTVGSLNCWENWMPLARFSLYGQGETLHIASLPGDHLLSQDLTKFIAMEGRVYSVCVGAVLRLEDIDDSFPLKKNLEEEDSRLLNGGSYIVDPSGEDVVPIKIGEEAILYADLCIEKVFGERRHFDPAGHYFSPSVFRLSVDKRRNTPIQPS